LRLAEIRDLLAVRDTGQCPCEPAEVMLKRHLVEIDAELARLASLRDELSAMLTGLSRESGPGCPDPEPGRWCPMDPTEGGDRS
jgi:hypothetical protein